VIRQAAVDAMRLLAGLREVPVEEERFYHPLSEPVQPTSWAPTVGELYDFEEPEAGVLGILADLTVQHGPWKAARILFSRSKEITMWRRSTACNGASSCVEVQEPSEETGGLWLVRDAKNPNGPVLSFDDAEWAAFTRGVRADEFDIRADVSDTVAPSAPPASPLSLP
jgi:hypothetical protein